MTDDNTSGATFAPAADSSAPAAGSETPAASFGSTRGSGLARGKRPSGAAAPTTGHTTPSDYKPTTIEVMAPKSEYKNPFASPEPENAPAAEPAEVEPIAIAPAPVAEAAPAPAPVAAPAAAPAEPEEEKREIQILPPAQAIRPAVSWEHTPSAPEAEPPPRAERPIFRAERREDRAPAPAAGSHEPAAPAPAEGFQREPRQPRDPRFARQPRDPRDERQPRDPREARQPRDPRDRQPRDPRDERPRYEQRPQGTATAAPAPRGFLAWLKGLFAPKPAEAPAAPREESRERSGESFGDGQHRRRRHRGGRGHGGHGGNPQGFRGEGSPQGGEREHRGGERPGGGRRRRHRGGRDRGSNPRSEGQQGGGAI
jgi:translation initiation factor IF-2